MKIQTTFFKATDGVKLKGIVYKSQSKTQKILISVHGMATNCIKERDEKIAEKVNELNIDFLAFNNRGHDLINYIKKESITTIDFAKRMNRNINSIRNIINGKKIITKKQYFKFKELLDKSHSS